MNRRHAHRAPGRLREAVDVVAFVLVLAGIVIALCAVDPATLCAPRVC